MDSRNPDELITEVKEEHQTRGELATETLQWFLDDNVGELFPRGDVVDRLSDELDIPKRQANTAVADTVGDIVDPVQQIVKGNKKYVGVIDYKIFNDEGAYGYIDFDDRKGERKRVVCARCVEKHKYDENITHATQGERSSDVGATWQQLLNKVTSHYATQHTTSPSHIEPGASLVSGTTISGNTAFHAGNESSISHDSTSGGTTGNPHADSASTSDVSSIQLSSDVNHDSTIGGTDSDAHHSKYTDNDARSALKSTGRVGGSGLFFDFNNSNNYIELVDGNNNRDELVTEDVYFNNGGVWLGDDHLGVSNAHHNKTTSSDINHDATSNRNHNNDSLYPDIVDVDNKVVLPRASPGDSVSEKGVIAYDDTNDQLLVSK